MKATRKILVALDAGNFEESLQKHTALFANKLGATQILGVHIVPVLKIADSVTVDARHPLSPAAPPVELIREKVEAQTSVLKKCCQHAEVGIAIREGQPYQSLVKLAGEIEADLLVMSRKKTTSGSGITAQKIARKVDCDLLFVPERISTTIENILVAVDFSENSARAVKKALYLADQLKLKQKLTLLNIMDIPPLSRVGDMDIYNLAGKSILILGAGGATRGILQPFLAQGPASVCIANRTVSKAEALVAGFQALAKEHKVGSLLGCGFDELAGQSFDWVFNATSASLQGDLPPLPDELVTPASWCYDLMYAAEPTPFCQWAQAHGVAHVMDGLGMLVEQAAESFALWRGVRPQTAELLTSLRQG